VDSVQSRRPGRVEVVERGVDVPAVEARDAGCLVGGRDGGLVEGGMGRVFERCALEALVIVLRSRCKMDFLVDCVLLLPWPYDSDVGSNACVERIDWT